MLGYWECLLDLKDLTGWIEELWKGYCVEIEIQATSQGYIGSCEALNLERFSPSAETLFQWIFAQIVIACWIWKGRLQPSIKC